jgi:hypothetical protein
MTAAPVGVMEAGSQPEQTGSPVRERCLRIEFVIPRCRHEGRMVK